MTHPRALSILAVIILAGLLVWWLFRTPSPAGPRTPPPAASGPGRAEFPVPGQPTPCERLLEGYGDPGSPPVEDLRKIHRVVTGYFSVVKDSSRNPIGGNADLAAALRGQNPNREVFVREGHPIFGKDGLIIDRWGSPVVVHPEEFRRLGLRSAGPDRSPYNADDLALSPTGAQQLVK